MLPRLQDRAADLVRLAHKEGDRAKVFAEYFDQFFLAHVPGLIDSEYWLGAAYPVRAGDSGQQD
jgi:hypothetical protein